MTHQPVAPSTRDIASTTSTKVMASSSPPPSARGIHNRNSPASAMASTRDNGSLRVRSLSSTCSAMRGARAHTASRGDDDDDEKVVIISHYDRSNMKVRKREMIICADCKMRKFMV